MKKDKKDKLVVPDIPIRDVLENRIKRMQILETIDRIKLTRLEKITAVEKTNVEIEKMKKGQGIFSSPVNDLIFIASAWYIDNTASVPGMDPTIKSLWDEEAMNQIRLKLMKKVREL